MTLWCAILVNNFAEVWFNACWFLFMRWLVLQYSMPYSTSQCPLILPSHSFQPSRSLPRNLSAHTNFIWWKCMCMYNVHVYNYYYVHVCTWFLTKVYLVCFRHCRFHYWSLTCPVSSPNEAYWGRCGLSRACNHIKAFSPVPFPLQRKLSGPTFLKYAGENTALCASGIVDFNADH